MLKQFVLCILGVLICHCLAFADTAEGTSCSCSLNSLEPSEPELSIPENGATNILISPELSWHSLLYTSSYHIQVSTNADFSDCIVNNSGITETTFQANNLNNGTKYYWRVSAENIAGEGNYSTVWDFTTAHELAIDNDNEQLPQDYALLPVYPNPFNPATNIAFSLPERSEVIIEIFNNVGQSVKQLVSSVQPAGEYTVQWDGNDKNGEQAGSGLYFCYLKTKNRSFVQKMLLIR